MRTRFLVKKISYDTAEKEFVVSNEPAVHQIQTSSSHMLVAADVLIGNIYGCFFIENFFMRVVSLLKRIVSLWQRKLPYYRV